MDRIYEIKKRAKIDGKLEILQSLLEDLARQIPKEDRNEIYQYMAYGAGQIGDAHEGNMEIFYCLREIMRIQKEWLSFEAINEFFWIMEIMLSFAIKHGKENPGIFAYDGNNFPDEFDEEKINKINAFSKAFHKRLYDYFESHKLDWLNQAEKEKPEIDMDHYRN